MYDASQHQHEHKGQRHAEKPENDRHWVCSVDHYRLPINVSIAVTFRTVRRRGISSVEMRNLSGCRNPLVKSAIPKKVLAIAVATSG